MRLYPKLIKISCVTCYKSGMKNEKIGKIGEIAVKRFLMKHRYDVLGCNIRVYQGKQIGEIDILAIKDETLYMVEVKTRDRSDVVMEIGLENGCNDWQLDDIYSRKKHAKLHKIRKLMLAIRGGAGSGFGDSEDLSNIRFLMDPQNGMDVELELGILLGIRRIKIILAQVTLISDNACRIDFHPVNSGYY